VHEEDFIDERSRILFMLSYMMEGPAELWADSYVKESLWVENWGSWAGFMEKLVGTFKDEEEGRRSLEAMATLRQGHGMATIYFFKLKQMAANPGVNPEDSHHITLQIE
jgi:hypothetical protein